nr:putative ribonuclease H-like domain-containing protein [Tanacetum cinerariifolium]
TKIHVDNESAICVVKNLVYHSKTKHIEIRHQFFRDFYEKRLIEMVKIHTDYNVADLLTKAFDVTRAYEAVIQEEGDRLEKAITTDASLEATHDNDNITKTQTTAMPNVDITHGIDTGGIPRCQETMGGTSAQTWSERVLEQPNEPPLTEGHTSGSREDKLDENIKLTDIVPTPFDSPLTGGYTSGCDKVVYNKDFITLTNIVKKLESQLKQKRSKAVIHSSDEEGPSVQIEDSPKQGRVIEEMDKYENINLVSEEGEVHENATCI